MQKILLGTVAAAALTLAAGLAVAQTGSPGSGTSAQSGQERTQRGVPPRSGNSSEQQDTRQSGARGAESQRRVQESGDERSAGRQGRDFDRGDRRERADSRESGRSSDREQRREFDSRDRRERADRDSRERREGSSTRERRRDVDSRDRRERYEERGSRGASVERRDRRDEGGREAERRYGRSYEGGSRSDRYIQEERGRLTEGRGYSARARGATSYRLSSRDRRRVQDILIRERRRGETADIDFPLRVGTRIPRYVEMYDLPGELVGYGPPDREGEKENFLGENMLLYVLC